MAHYSVKRRGANAATSKQDQQRHNDARPEMVAPGDRHVLLRQHVEPEQGGEGCR